ncbi:hypothetical protein AAC387_Pa10g1282 [Persea americana]
MESLRANYRDEEDDSSEPNDSQSKQHQNLNPIPTPNSENGPKQEEFDEAEENGNNEDEEDEADDTGEEEDEPKSQKPPNLPTQPSSDETDDDEDDDIAAPPRKKQKPLSSFNSPSPSPSPATAAAEPPSDAPAAPALKKPKKKTKAVNVWTKSTSRKGKKKAKPASAAKQDPSALITPAPRFPDKSDDTPDMKICLSKVHKAEKVELGEERLSAGSTKGYRMVRATRGVLEGAWYFEIKVVNLGETGHTRLGWSTEKGDLQAPVGSDANSFGYRDLDGSKVHRAMREKYGEVGYFEGDVVGCYINLPDGAAYTPKRQHFGLHKEQKYSHPGDKKEDPPKVVPGSEISFFKNGVCQGVAFRDICGGRYYPAASMYTLPDQPNCVVKFNFGPDFEVFPEDFAGRPIPKPMIEVPYHGYDGIVERYMRTGLTAEKEH